MKAEAIWLELDKAGLTPECHYMAAPDKWRTALERLEALIEESFELQNAREFRTYETKIDKLEVAMIRATTILEDASK